MSVCNPLKHVRLIIHDSLSLTTVRTRRIESLRVKEKHKTLVILNSNTSVCSLHSFTLLFSFYSLLYYSYLFTSFIILIQFIIYLTSFHEVLLNPFIHFILFYFSCLLLNIFFSVFICINVCCLFFIKYIYSLNFIICHILFICILLHFILKNYL